MITLAKIGTDFNPLHSSFILTALSNVYEIMNTGYVFGAVPYLVEVVPIRNRRTDSSDFVKNSWNVFDLL